MRFDTEYNKKTLWLREEILWLIVKNAGPIFRTG